MRDELHYGTPPHVGWWATYGSVLNTSKLTWRWWDGRAWSAAALPSDSAFEASRRAEIKHSVGIKYLWSYYWPENGRVERVNPETGEVTGAIYGK